METLYIISGVGALLFIFWIILWVIAFIKIFSNYLTEYPEYQEGDNLIFEVNGDVIDVYEKVKGKKRLRVRDYIVRSRWKWNIFPYYISNVGPVLKYSRLHDFIEIIFENN